MNDITCAACGGRLPANSQYCSHCGCVIAQAAVYTPPAAPANTCPACGRPAGGGSAFCMGCGASLAGAAGRQPAHEPVHTYAGPRQATPSPYVPAYRTAAPPRPVTSGGKRSRGPLVAAIAVVLAAALLITGFWQPGFFLEGKTNGNISTPYAGNSAAFSITPLPGFTISAEENALDRDRTFDVAEASGDTFAEVGRAMEDSGLLLMELYEVDAGLDEDRSFPGTFSMTYDLTELDIPEELYDYLSVCRIGDDGTATELVCTVGDGELTCRSDKNCGIALVAGLTAWGLSVFVGTMAVEDYAEKWKGLSGKNIMHVDICDGQYRVSWAAEDNTEWTEERETVDSLLAEMREIVDSELGVEPGNTGYSYKTMQARNRLLAQKISQNEQYLTHLKKYETLTQNLSEGTPQVKQVVAALSQVHKYLAVTQGFTAPSSMTDVLLVYDWPAGDSSLGYANNPKAGAPYLQINMSRFPGDGSALSVEVMDELYLTVTHELFHVFQVGYTTIDWNRNIIFWEATACRLEREAQADYRSNTKDASLPSVSAKQALTDTDWFETLSVSFGEMPASGKESDCQRTGYTLSRFIAYIQTEYSCSFKLKALLEAFRDTGDFRAALQLISGFSDSMLSNAYLNFCRANVKLFYTRYKNTVAPKGTGVKNTLIPAVQLSASNDKVDVPVADAPLSAYIRAFSVDTKSVGGAYALLLVSDPSLAAKQDYSLVNFTAGVTKTTKGLFYPVKTDASSYLLEIHAYTNPDDVNAFYTAYLLAPPEAPAVSINGDIMTVEMPPESRAARDGLIDGYLLTITATDGVVSVISEEHVPYGKWGDPLKLKLSELSALPGEVSYSVTAQEYMKDRSGQNYLYGPASPGPEAKPEKVELSGIYIGESSGQHVDSSETFDLQYPAIRIEERSDGLLIGACMENGDYEAELQVLCKYNADTGYYEGFSRLEDGDQWTELEVRADIHMDGDVPRADVAWSQVFCQHYSPCLYYFEGDRQMGLTGQAVSPATGSSGSGSSTDTPAGQPVGGANPFGGAQYQTPLKQPAQTPE